jgi:dipeptide/tripeptide permease
VAETGKKKIVRETSTPAPDGVKATKGGDVTWTPTPEAKKKATLYRIIAAVLWVLAIGSEAFAIFWVLKQDPINMVVLIVMIVVIGLLAVGGSLLWKQANRLDPASKSNAVRFFVQNQLGLIVTIIAFLPLIILIFTNKNMDGKQKGIAGAIAIVVLLVAGYFGTSFNPPSSEQYTAETQQVVDITGQDLVFWTTSGKVFHLCSDASAVNLESQDNTIHSGTVAQAHAAGKDRLTLQVEQEIKQCGFDEPATPPSP